jgi:redox-sensing transcriptional repressor
MADVRVESTPRRISEATVERLPIYERLLAELLRTGHPTVSSEQLASLARVNAAKVRKDLSLLGSFGTRGTGYDTAFLLAQIHRALGVDRDWPVAIVGIGNLGRALANSEGFSSHGFRVTALFDANPSVIGTRVGPVVVRDIAQLGDLRENDVPAIGVVSTPAAAAQAVTDLLVGIGVRSILNFAPTVLNVPSSVMLRYVDLSIELQVMSFYQSRSTGEPPGSQAIALLHSVGVGPGGAR